MAGNGRSGDAEHLDLEVQGLAREGMVQIQGDGLVADLGHAGLECLALAGAAAHHSAHVELVGFLEGRLGNLVDRIRIVIPVGLFGRDANVLRVALGKPGQLLFQPRNDVASP